MNIYDLTERARSLSGIRLQSIRSDTQVEEVVNEAYQEILGMQPWPFLRGEYVQSIAAGQNSFTLEQGFRYISSVVLLAGGDEERLEASTLDELERRGARDGRPVLYARVDSDNFVVWPTPEETATVTLRGQLEPPRLSGSTQPVFAQEYHPAIAYRAAARMLIEEGDDSGRSGAYQQEATEYVRRMEKHYLGSGDVAMIRMGGRGRRRNAYRH